ncbi:MAG: PaaI family thioesterase [Candidatus Eremiobacteraeota bacterium]|nr:PaaI family thioesterase [Candidatus Eremiobacteraeota bacterium]
MDAPPRTYGLAAPEQTAGKSGREILQAIIDGELPAPPMAETLRFWLAEVGDGYAAFEGETGPHILNPHGTVHGGWAMTLIDSATGCAAHTLLEAGAKYTTVETKVNFSRPILADTGRVRAEAHVVNKGRQIISAECRLVDAAGKVLAHGTSTLMVLSRP